MNLALHLKIAGVLQLVLALAHFDFPRRFGWRKELSGVTLLAREVFWVHLFFVTLVVAGFGVLSIAGADELVKPGPLARMVLCGLAVFWFARWICQFFVYSSELWRGNRIHTIMHVMFSLLWTYLTAVYATAFAFQW